MTTPTHLILPGATHWLRAGTPATSVCRVPTLYGTSPTSGTYIVDAYPDTVFYEEAAWLTEPPTSIAAILAAAGRPTASSIVLCTTRPADRCRCGTYKPADLAECICCVIARDDAQGTEWVHEAEEEAEEDDDDYGVCAGCLGTYTGDGFHGFCGPTCAAVRGVPICHCCYE